MRRLGRVIWREMGRIASRPLLWVATLGAPIFVVVFLSSVFGDGVMEELPVGVVDLDNTCSSRTIVRTINASPKLNVTQHLTASHEAIEAVRSGAIYGFVTLPSGLSRAMARGEETTIAYYYHYALMSIGGEVATSLRTILEEVKAAPIATTLEALGVSSERTLAFLAPVGANVHPLGNPSLNYRTYLAEPFFFIMLQVLVLLVTIYVIGGEREARSGREWLQCAQGDMAVAIVGKLLPYSLAFCTTSLTAIAILHSDGALNFWEALQQWFYAVLLVAASEGLAIFIYALVPSMALSMSFLSMIGSLGATLSGVTFPLMAMYPLFEHIALLLPVRHFTLLLQGIDFSAGWIHVVVLMVFMLLPLLCTRRLQRVVTQKVQSR